MSDVDPREAKKALNRWARGQGYSDFDVYMLAGGSIRDAMTSINRQRHHLDLATVAIYQWQAPPPVPPPPAADPELEDYERANQRIEITDAALRAAEADVTGEPIEEDNAQTQGFEL